MVPSLDIRVVGGSTNWLWFYEIYKSKSSRPGRASCDLLLQRKILLRLWTSALKSTPASSQTVTVFLSSWPVITRSHIVVNEGRDAVIHKLSSLSLIFQRTNGNSIHLLGAWDNERQLQNLPSSFERCILTVRETSHQVNPLVALVKNDTILRIVKVPWFCFSLLSGNHLKKLSK